MSDDTTSYGEWYRLGDRYPNDYQRCVIACASPTPSGEEYYYVLATWWREEEHQAEGCPPAVYYYFMDEDNEEAFYFDNIVAWTPVPEYDPDPGARDDEPGISENYASDYGRG